MRCWCLWASGEGPLSDLGPIHSQTPSSPAPPRGRQASGPLPTLAPCPITGQLLDEGRNALLLQWVWLALSLHFCLFPAGPLGMGRLLWGRGESIKPTWLSQIREASFRCLTTPSLQDTGV